MSQRILGIDLGTYSIKILHLERHAGDLHLLDFFELPLNLHTRHQHDEQVKEVLNPFFNDHSFDVDVVSLSLPGHVLSSRVIEVPFTNAKKIAGAVEFELEGLVPFPIEDVFCDYHVLNQEENLSQILCSYTYEGNIQKYLDCLSDIGMDSKYLGADFADLAGIGQVGMLPPEGYYAICDIGHTKTNLLIMDGPYLKYARTIGVGGYHFTRAIQRSFNLNYEKAEALKLARGKLFVREQESDQVSRILSKVAAELVSAMKQTFMGATKYCDAQSIPAIYCCGGGTRLVGILEHLSFQLRTNVFDLDALPYTHHHFDEPDEINRVVPQVLATAIRPFYFNRMPRINFRKGPFAFKRDLQVITREFKVLAGFLVLIVLLGGLYYFLADRHYSKKIVRINKTVETLLSKQYSDISITKSKKKGSAGVEKKISGYVKNVDRKIKDFEDVFSSDMASANVLQVLQEISRKLPTKQEINFETREFDFKEDFIRIEATTNDALNVEKIVESLRGSSMFASITSSDAKPKPGGRWDFDLKMTLKKDVEEE